MDEQQKKSLEEELKRLEAEEELARLEAEERGVNPQQSDKNFLEKALEVPEKYVSAPARAGYAALAAGEPLKALPAIAEQFGAPPEEAPTMRQVMQIAGVPETPVNILAEESPDVYGFRAAKTGILPEKKPPVTIPASMAAGIAGEFLDPSIPVGLEFGARGIRFTSAALPMIGKLGKMAASGGMSLAEIAASNTAKGAGYISGAALTQSLPKAEKWAAQWGDSVENVFEQIRNLPRTVGNAWYQLKPQVRDKYIEQALLAQRNGIDPELLAETPRLVYGPDAMVTKLAEADASTIQTKLTQNFRKLQDQINTGLTNIVEKIGRGRADRSRISAGNAIRDSYNKSVDNLFDQAAVRYSTLVDEIPNGSLDITSSKNLYNALGRLAEEQEKILKFASTEAAKKQPRANLEAINNIRENIFNTVPKEESFLGRVIRTVQGKPAPTKQIFSGDLEIAIDQLQQIGREAYKGQQKFGVSDVPAEKGLLKGIYKDLRNTIIDSVKRERPDLVEPLLESNRQQAQFFDQNKFIGSVIQDSEKAPERVYEALVLNGDTNTINALRSVLTSDGLDAVKGQALFDLLKVTPEKAETTFGAALRNINSQNSQKLLKLFEEGELGDFKGLVKLGADMGTGEFNPSGSGKLVLLKKFMTSPIESTIASMQGKTIAKSLEVSGMRQYLADLSVPEIIDLRGKGFFEDSLVEQVLKERLQNVNVSGEIKQAILKNQIPQSFIPTIQKITESSLPDNNWAVLKDYLTKTGKTVSFGILPNGNDFDTATRMMKTLSSVRDMSADPTAHQMPVLIPAEDRDAVAQSIINSSMNSISKAKNLKSLKTSGYLLDTSEFSGRRPQSEDRSKMQNKPVEVLDFDKPDFLKKNKELNRSFKDIVDKMRSE